MGGASRRCKNQWVRWTAPRLEGVPQLPLVRYADPEHHQSFLDELLQRSIQTALSCDLTIESTKANYRPLCDTTNWMR